MTITLVKPEWMPEPLFQAIQRDKKEKLPGVDYTITELIGPARIAALLEKHDVQISAAERVWALLGKGLHHVLEAPEFEFAMVEETLRAKLDGVCISGTPDLVDDTGVIHDWKLCSVWAWILGLKEEWEQQLNCYAWLYRRDKLCRPLQTFHLATEDETGKPVLFSPNEPRDLRVHMIFRDWHRSRANGIDYPATEIHSVSVVKWPDDRTTAFLRERIAAHRAARESLPACTSSERWHRAGRVAVMKQGNKKAAKLCDTEQEALEWIQAQGQLKERWFSIVPRPGTDVRCLDWCPARSVCDYAKSFQAAESIFGDSHDFPSEESRT